ncbi:2TM domain-containing protein [Breznakiella homolactica]|uniref:2TM domain-containing protein n=1 Tax=Breznakiella homolactica TaxID=2798577 RepID=A0A7T8B9Z0_9SPIR|nr:2TM domain-containing protein [Breznakiella homolactica]QQO07683.1 2TM domain-containing protein [Breznakiella homolactica]
MEKTSELHTMTEQELMKLARKRVEARSGFTVHLIAGIGASILSVIIYLLTSLGGYFWPMWVMIALGLSLVAHGAAVFPSSRFNRKDKVKAEYDRLRQKYSFTG